MINQQQLENALNAYVNNSQTLGQLIGIANQCNFNTNDAKQAAMLMGSIALSSNSNDATVVANIGGAYESVLYVGLLESGRCPQANDTNYHNARVNDFRIIKDRAQQQQAPQQNNGSMFGTQQQATGGMFDTAPAQNANDMFCDPVQPAVAPNMFEVASTTVTPTVQAAPTAVETVQPAPQFQLIGAETAMEELSKHIIPKMIAASAPIRVINDDLQVFRDFQENLDVSTLDVSSTEIEFEVKHADSTIRCKAVHNTNTYRLETDVAGAVEIIDLLNVEVTNMLSEAYRAKDCTDTNEQWSILLKNLGGAITMIRRAADELSELESIGRMYMVDIDMMCARLSAELYSIFNGAIFYATGNGSFPDFDGSNNETRLFVPDYSDLPTELEQFEDLFYSQYNGHCADTFSQMFTYIAKMCGSIIFDLDDQRNLLVGTRELRLFVGMELFTGVTEHFTSPAASKLSPNVVRLLDNLLDAFEDKFGRYRLHVTDIALSSKYIDRAYPSDNTYVTPVKA